MGSRLCMERSQEWKGVATGVHFQERMGLWEGCQGRCVEVHLLGGNRGRSRVFEWYGLEFMRWFSFGDAASYPHPVVV